ncbi:imm11 family protein [Vibrio campbellii]|uniref:imm11 family protein n=1 Tax=Vibrio campbellii TaxID=680 RepID=UPI00168CC599|nr:DUF1629 domain-containing protein [Vibrio campbellii]
MKYYLLFSKFEKGEGSFSVQEPWNLVLEYHKPQVKLLETKGIYLVDKCYKEKGMSDCLKVGVGKLASQKVQKIFFEHGFTGIQFIPVTVENDGLHEDYAFMNPIAHYDLLDAEASEARELSEVYGGYTSVIEEVLDQDKFDNAIILHDCFTLSTYKDPYYVSERVKAALEAEGVTGIEFIPMEFA